MDSVFRLSHDHLRTGLKKTPLPSSIYKRYKYTMPNALYDTLNLMDMRNQDRLCILSQFIYNDGAPLERMQRKEPLIDPYSGWWIYGLSDTEEEFGQEQSMICVSLEVAANLCPEIIKFVEMPVGTILARSNPGEPLELISHDN